MPEDCYQSAAFVRLVEGTPRIGAVVGSNFCDNALHERDGNIVVMATLDNLVKGMAGQAVQNMNIAQGWDEIEGLMSVGVCPV